MGIRTDDGTILCFIRRPADELRVRKALRFERMPLPQTNPPVTWRTARNLARRFRRRLLSIGR
jgi:hypothetical protein